MADIMRVEACPEPGRRQARGRAGAGRGQAGGRPGAGPTDGPSYSDEIVSLNPVGSVTSNARAPHSVSRGSESRVMPAAFARAAT